MVQTRTVAPASGIPRELNTMSSLREPCACAGRTVPGHTCSASASNAQRNPVAVFDRIITASKLALVGVCYTQQRKRGEAMVVLRLSAFWIEWLYAPLSQQAPRKFRRRLCHAMRLLF